MMEKLQEKQNAIEEGRIYVSNENTEISVFKENKFIMFLQAIKRFLSKSEVDYEHN